MHNTNFRELFNIGEYGFTPPVGQTLPNTTPQGTGTFLMGDPIPDIDITLNQHPGGRGGTRINFTDQGTGVDVYNLFNVVSQDLTSTISQISNPLYMSGNFGIEPIVESGMNNETAIAAYIKIGPDMYSFNAATIVKSNNISIFVGLVTTHDISGQDIFNVQGHLPLSKLVYIFTSDTNPTIGTEQELESGIDASYAFIVDYDSGMPLDSFDFITTHDTWNHDIENYSMEIRGTTTNGTYVEILYGDAIIVE